MTITSYLLKHSQSQKNMFSFNKHDSPIQVTIN